MGGTFMLIDNYDLETLLTNDDLFPWLLNKAEEVRLKERGDKGLFKGINRILQLLQL